jgi:hydrogenase maturation protease
MRVLIGGIGYLYLRDGSLGPAVVALLSRETWPPGVLVEDLSYGPVAVMQRLEDMKPPFDRLVLVGAVSRGRAAGAISVYQWTGPLPDETEIQARVGEAVTGVISLDNLLVVAGFFDTLPREVLVVEVEPQDEGWGEGFSPVIEAAQSEVLAVVRQLACEGDVEVARA